MEVAPASNLAPPAAPTFAVPTADELQAWEARFKAAYRAQHRARNQAFLQMFETDDNGEPLTAPMRLDHAVAYVEAEVEAAEALVSMDVEALSAAQGRGFCAMRDGKPIDSCAETDRDLFMSWHAGYQQAQPQKVLAVDDPARPRGYTPPSVYVCPLCDAPEGQNHTGPKRTLPLDYGRGGHQEACEDHLVVVRAPKFRPGVNFK